MPVNWYGAINPFHEDFAIFPARSGELGTVTGYCHWTGEFHEYEGLEAFRVAMKRAREKEKEELNEEEEAELRKIGRRRLQ